MNPKLVCKRLIAYLLGIAVTSPLVSGQGLSPSTPSKEFIRYNGQTVAVANAVSGPAGPGVYSWSDPRVKYSGTWTAYNTNQAGASASLQFTGSSVSFVFWKDASSGIANISIDGAAVSPVDEYTSSASWLGGGLRVATFTGLTNASHTIQVTASGNKNPNSGGTSIRISSLIVGPIGNDNAPAFTYSGSWTDTTGLQYAWSSDEHVTSAVGDSVSIAFTGPFVSVIFSDSSSAGQLKVQIDGQAVGVIGENYSGSAAPSDDFRLIRTYTGLSNGPHTLKLTCAPFSSAPSNTTVYVDAVLTPQ